MEDEKKPQPNFKTVNTFVVSNKQIQVQYDHGSDTMRIIVNQQIMSSIILGNEQTSATLLP